ncbi:endonuclease domain-containing protein [Brevibacterium sp. RIT 803]|uniref:endonuclease domain-containing protein n=1 Tax=Brevibacterium sp. RIT 803 TaxID=2810210 RepID=UPI00194ECB9C|nr:endonuclease domain-containing protein [Brevibacterium sp. RIT 803]MBM6588912.1 hypothetical protein [Brevibacterium sp. RIT 803]
MSSTDQNHVVDIDPIMLLKEHQNGHCAVCGEVRMRLRIDHDHDTGLVRGLLCNGCNTSEGRDFRAPWFERYRANPPAARLGLRVQYRNRMPVTREIESLIKELAELIREDGWGIGELSQVKGDAAFNIVDDTEIVECVSLWSEGQHKAQFTWGNTGRCNDFGQVLNTEHTLPASTPVERVADIVTWTMRIDQESERLTHLLHQRFGLVNVDMSFNIEREIAVASFDCGDGQLKRIVTNGSDIYFWSDPAFRTSLIVPDEMDLERVATWVFQRANELIEYDESKGLNHSE